MSITPYKIVLGISVGVTTLIGLFSVMPSSLATTSSSSKNAVVTVGASCSMNSTVSTAHTATIAQGNYNKGIGLTEVTTTCNDAGGYAIYAVGYGDDTLGNNVLHSATAGSTYDIATGNDFANATTSYSSNASQWAMRVAAVSGQTDSPTITNNFDSLSLVPATYTKVAQYNANTSTPSTSSITTEYGAYIAIGQPAGTYTGKVKYTLVHPSTEPAPKVPPVACNKSVPNISYMQEINSSNKATILNSLTEGEAYYLRDSRDEEPYCVSKLVDGNLWMLDNLRLDLTNRTIINNISSSNTNASSTTLGYLKHGGGTASDQYAITGLDGTNWTSASGESGAGYSYSMPLANVSGLINDVPYTSNTVVDGLGVGSHIIGPYYNYCAVSAGSYCYGNDISGGSPSGSATEDICPVNWRIPTGGNSGEYRALANLIAGEEVESLQGDDAVKYETALSIAFSGNHAMNNTNGHNWYGYFWSSAMINTNDMYSLYAYNGGAQPIAFSGSRSYGFSARCLLK